MINWNDDILIDEMRMIMLLDSWTMTETDKSMEFIKEDKLLRVEKHFPPHSEHRAFCRLFVGDVFQTRETGVITFESRLEALQYLDLEAYDEKDDARRARDLSLLGWMES